MSIAQRLVNLADGLTADGVLSAAKGGTGTTTGAGSSVPTISAIGYGGDDTATNPAGGATITLTGTNFASGAKVLINTTPVGVVTVVSATQITFTAPQLAAGSYILYVVNLDGSTAIAVPGIQYSGTPAWSTAAGTLGTGYETSAVSSTVTATSDSAVSYSVVSGTLPSGVTINASGTISGTSPLVGGSTTYTFTVRATDAENQDTDRSFSLTINPDVVTWSSLNTISLPQNVASTTTLAATSAAGQTVSYAVDTLPTGLTLSGATVSGTPTAAGATITTATATAAVTGKTAQQTITWTISIAADTYFPYTTLLLNSETTALPFLADASTNNFAITAVGDTKPNNFNPYTPGYYSNYFDGSGDYISTPSITAAGGDFTLEGWINGSSTQPQIYATAIHFNGVASTSYELWIQFNHSSNPGKIRFSVSTTVIVSSASQVANTWYHVAIVRSGSTVTCYIDGVNIGSTTYTAPLGGGALSVGQWPGSSATAYAGYVSNVRFVNGTALYTTNFTPPTGPLTAVAGTSLLTCQSNRFVDNSTNAFALTKVGDVAVSPFDPFAPNSSYATYGSTYLDGTGDYLSIPSNSAFGFGTSDFTVEAWVYVISTATDRNIFDFRTAGPNENGTFFIDTVNGKLAYWNGTKYGSTGTALALNTWHHVAFSRQSGTTRAYLNGVLDFSTATVFDFSTTKALGIGGATYSGNLGGGPMNGYIADARIVKGTALYTTAFTPPATPLTAITNTSLLTCQTNQPNNNQTFLDNSSNAFPVTRTGNTTQGSFSPYGANWSTYFNGSTDYLDINYTALQSYAGNATIECWFKLNAFPTGTSYNDSMYIIGSNPSASNPGIDFAVGSNAIWFSQATYPQRTLAGTWTPNLNWHHIAVTRNTNTWTMWLDGVSIATATSLDGFSTATIISIGRCEPTGGEATGYMNGYISNLRIVKGTALYTSAFTPSTQPLTAVSGTSLLTCQSASFVDNSPNASVITPKGTISTQKFNPFATVTQTPLSHSVSFDGSGDYLSIPTTSGNLNQTGDFTYEMWIYWNSMPTTGYQNIAGQGTGGQSSYGLLAANASSSTWSAPYVFKLNIANSGDVLNGNTALVAGQWYHLAHTRTSGVNRLFVNGVVQTNTYTDSTSRTFAGNPYQITDGNSNCYISNFRFIQGTSLYTTTFTPPTQPLTAIANTQLLTCQSPTLTDNSVNQFAVTAFGDTKPRQQNPFGWTTSSTQDYSTTTFGGSVYLDGTGDFLTVPNTTATAFGTGDFTIEFWTYLDKFGDNRFVDFASSSILYMGSSAMIYYINGSVITSSAMVLNTWYHVALVRSSGTSKMYLNGTQTGVNYTDATNYTGASTVVGTDRGSNSQFLKGYISDLRITKGTAVYKANFVPPTAPLTAIQNTTLLLSGDKSAIADKSGKVVLESVGDTKLSTAVKKYGSSSMYFDGTGDYLSIPNNPVFNFGTGDFTVEAWIYLPTVTNVGIIGFGSGGFFVQINTSTNIHISQANVVDLGDFTISPAISANTWYHLAMTRSGTSMRAFINGIQQGSTLTNSTNFTATNATIVGGHPGPIILYSGYMDDLRVTRGYARYTSNFTPPTSALLTK